MTAVTPVALEVGPLTRTDFVKYAGASGDFNPVHHDDEYARAHGFPSVFAMGMLPAGILGAQASAWAGPTALSSFTVRFVSQTWPGETLTFSLGDAVPDSEGFLVAVNAGTTQKIKGVVELGVSSPRPEPSEETDPRLDQIRSVKLSPVVLPVELGKALEFARAVRAPAIFTDESSARAAGLDALPAVPTFTTCVAHWDGGDATAVPRSVGLDLTRVLHAEQRYEFHRPVLVGDVLHGERWVSRTYTKRSRHGALMTFVRVTTAFTDSRGNPVVREEMLMVETPRDT